MTKDKMTNETLLCFSRIYLRSFGITILFSVILFNFKASIQPYSLFSIATTMINLEQGYIHAYGLLYDLAFFAFILLITHLLWSGFIAISTLSPWIKIKNRNQQELYWLLIVILNITCLISINSYLYPTSLVSYFRHTPLSQPLLWSSLSILLLISFFRGINVFFSKKTIVLVTIFISTFLAIPFVTTEDKHVGFANRPNIIIIGVDGLRPDHLAYMGAERSLAPNLNALLDNMVIYPNAYTPQGRTYVAWMSLLTGQYPVNNGIRFNLAPPEQVDKRLPIIELLKQRGYATTYAIDERRFNQIDSSYGFDNVVGPKTGAADALIAMLGDLPYLNIMLQHPYSASVLPYLYNNRAYGKAYSPINFNRATIDKLKSNKPHFLAIHYCQLHWPYTSKDFIPENKLPWDGNYNHYMYKTMMAKVDKQIGDLFKRLKKNGLLDNAIVYLISDHGESFKLADYTPQYVAKKNTLPETKSWGHGTNILDQQQSHILLARAKFKDTNIVTANRKVSGLYSLVDIVPTLLNSLAISIDEISIQSPKVLDGEVLPLTVQNIKADRFIFVESSVPINSINKSFINKKDVMSETASIYEVRNDGQVYMQPQSYVELIAKKQRAIYFKEWQLSLLPGQSSPLLFNTKTQMLSTTSQYQGDFDWKNMLKQLCTHYQDDLGFDENMFCSDEILSSKTALQHN